MRGVHSKRAWRLSQCKALCAYERPGPFTLRRAMSSRSLAFFSRRSCRFEATLRCLCIAACRWEDFRVLFCSPHDRALSPWTPFWVQEAKLRQARFWLSFGLEETSSRERGHVFARYRKRGKGDSGTVTGL